MQLQEVIVCFYHISGKINNPQDNSFSFFKESGRHSQRKDSANDKETDNQKGREHDDQKPDEDEDEKERNRCE